MVFRDDLTATVNRILQDELVELTEEEVKELADKVVEAIHFDHEIVEDFDEPEEEETEEEEEDFIDDDTSSGRDD